jgi:signal transduction histidine kinase
MQKNSNDIIIFLFIVSALILALIAFIMIILYLYRKKQISFFQNLEQIKLDHEKALMATQLEMQETTFQHISREIHDNISLSLTLVKLHLNTLNLSDKDELPKKINSSVELLTRSINDLSDISKGLNADIIKQQGLIKALESEVRRIRDVGLFTLNSSLTGNPIYMDGQKELILFRVVQEAFNNIIKHAKANHIELSLHYDSEILYITINDNGNGFDTSLAQESQKAGLKNMEARIKTLQGTMSISSLPELGTSLSFNIPIS